GGGTRVARTLRLLATLSRGIEARFVWLLLIIGMLLLFADLGDIYLWQDEAETALIARHWLAYGLPLSTDGVTWVQQQGQPFIEFTQDYIWISHSWMQFALTAASFAVLGVSTVTARLPSVLAGLATLCFFYRFLLRWLKNDRVAHIAAVLLLFCVPFILLVRQCRYYVFSVLFTLLTLDSYLYMRSGKAWAMPYFILSAVLLFHSHYLAFVPTVAALLVHLISFTVMRKVWPRFLLAFVLVATLVTPWACFMRLESRSGFLPTQGRTARAGLLRWDRFVGQLGQYFLQITLWIFPLLFIPVLIFAWLRRSDKDRWALDSKQASFCQLCSLVVVVNLLTLSGLGWVFFRYLAHLIPLLLAMLSVAIVWLARRWFVFAYVLLAIVITSNGLHILPYKLLCATHLEQSHWWQETSASPATNWISLIQTVRFRSDIWMYAQELTHPYEGPIEGLVAYLSQCAKPGQTILVNDEDLPLQFYTNQRVLGGLSGHGLTLDLHPDWVIDRKYGHYRDILATIIQGGLYERIEIPYPDICNENREEVYKHHYLTVQGEDHVVLYRRKGD
ncbi:MAG: ArnT family glycosyltransferase, partial [Anaerolineae bacterium]